MSTTPDDMNLPGWRFHGLQGKPKRRAVDASGNYRITFAWDDAAADALAVDIEDYHRRTTKKLRNARQGVAQ